MGWEVERRGFGVGESDGGRWLERRVLVLGLGVRLGRVMVLS